MKIRETFLPDEGCVFVRVDMSQIEDRVCKMYCGSDRLVELANKHPSDYDAHTENARLIFKKQTITKQERYLGKKCVHGAERQMGGGRMSESVSKDTRGELFIHPRQCDKLLRSFYDAMPELEGTYFPWVEWQVRNVGFLYNSWGRRLDVRHRRVDDDLYKEAYSYYLQSEAADWTNQYLFLPTYYYMMGRYGKAVNEQTHDEVGVSVPVEDAYDAAKFMLTSAEQCREIPKGSGNVLCVPAEVTIGRSWGDPGVEFNRLPEKDKFAEKLRERGFDV